MKSAQPPWHKDPSAGGNIWAGAGSRKFGMSYLPTDFAAIVTFRVRPGSKNIILKGIYNHNEDLQNYEMASGDSVTVLITKADGFRYQILNHSS